MRYVSVCSGIEAASLAWEPLGMRPRCFAEIDKFASRVLEHRYPGVPNLGDITRADFVERARKLGPVDILVGGCPCQDFSVAGLRAGLDGERGQLALRFLELARDLRPKWVLFENVPGLLSSGGGRDFGSFLGGLAELGYGFAWRVLDAQAFGVPQRRRRVFVVGYLGDWRGAFAVLFERPGVPGDPPPGRRSRKEVAGALTASSGRRGGVPDGGDAGGHLIVHTLRGEGFDASEDGTGRGTPLVPVVFDTTQITSPANYSNPKPGDPCHPLTAHGHAPAIAFQERGRPGGRTLEWQEDKAYALLAPTGGARTNELNVCAPVAFQQHGSDVGEMGTLRRGNGDVQSGVPFIVHAIGTRVKSDYAREADVSLCLDAYRPFASNQGGTLVVESKSLPNPIDSQSVPFIVNAAHSCAKADHARQSEVSRCLDSSGSFATNQGGTVVVAPTLNANGKAAGSATQQDAENGALIPVAFHATQDPICGEVSPCLPTSKGSIGVACRWGVRRLTPLECERLQGMPDDWTLVPVRKLKKPTRDRLAKLEDLGRLGYVDGEPWELAADGPRYRAIGNSMAVPCVRWIGERMLMVDRIMDSGVAGSDWGSSPVDRVRAK